MLPRQIQIQQNINNKTNHNIIQTNNSSIKNPLNNIQIPPPTNNHNISNNNSILSPHKTMINMLPQQTLSLINKENISMNSKNNVIEQNKKVPLNPLLQNINYIQKSNSNPNFLNKGNQYYQQNPIFIKQQSDDIPRNKNRILLIILISFNIINKILFL